METVSSASAPVPVGIQPVRPSKLADELLARYAGHGNARAFAAIYERYHQRLYSYCRSILRDDEDARDALQATFESALSALQRRQRSAPLRPWLFKIAHNEAISLIRRRERMATDEFVGLDGLPSHSAEEEAAGRARWALLMSDLVQLPERLRGALLLRELNGLSHEEIAVALSTTTGAAKQAILEARRALVELEEGRAMPCDEVQQRLSDGDRRVLRGRRVSAHLRDCAVCEAFAASIAAHENDLRAFTPILPATASAALLARVVGASSGHAAGTASAGVTALVGKAAGTITTWKAVAGAVAVVATASAGVFAVKHTIDTSAKAPGATHAAPGRGATQKHAGPRHQGGRHSGRGAGTRSAAAAHAHHHGANVHSTHHAAAHARGTTAVLNGASSASSKSAGTPVGTRHGASGAGAVHSNGHTHPRGTAFGHTRTTGKRKPKPADVTHTKQAHPGQHVPTPTQHRTSTTPASTTPATTSPTTSAPSGRGGNSTTAGRAPSSST